MDQDRKNELHTQIMRSICQVIAREGKPLVLKGGTALMLAYALDRFSEDLDFDLTKKLKTHLNVQAFCESAALVLRKQGAGIKVSAFKDLKRTGTSHRCRAIFNAPELDQPIGVKIEISARNMPQKADIVLLDGLRVYTPDKIARLELNAALESPGGNYRTAARDLHDIVHISTTYADDLKLKTLDALAEFLKNPEALAIRYGQAYEADPILAGRLYDDLDRAERWLVRRRDRYLRDTLGIGPS